MGKRGSAWPSKLMSNHRKSSFIKFNDIRVEDQATWEGKKILTFDIDWACDEMIEYVTDLVEDANVPVIFLVTHETRLLERFRLNKNIQLGIHPNFNPLVENQGRATGVVETIRNLKKIVPDAEILRSHSLTTSGRMLGTFRDAGIRFLSNYMMTGVDTIEPFYHVNGLIECPIFFADDGYMMKEFSHFFQLLNIDKITEKHHKGLRVFNFHPINIALNMSDSEQYEAARPFYKDWKRLTEFKNDRFGVENILKKLLRKDRS